MKIERCEKESFVVIGKEGSSLDGAEFIPKLWDEANFYYIIIFENVNGRSACRVPFP